MNATITTFKPRQPIVRQRLNAIVAQSLDMAETLFVNNLDQHARAFADVLPQWSVNNTNPEELSR
jgi:hypothetical protein